MSIKKKQSMQRTSFAFGTTLSVTCILFMALPQLFAQGGTWATKTPMPTAREHLSTGVVNGVVYAVGGYNGTVLTTVEAYDPVSDSWITKTPLPTLRAYESISVVNSILYVVGGDYGHGILNTVEAYDPASDTWTGKASMPTARYLLSTSEVNGVIYAIGGTFDTSISGSALAKVEAYDPASNTWTTKASMPTARWGLATEVVNGVIYAMGGYDSSNNSVGTVEAYDPVSDTWTTKTSMPTARDLLGASMANGVIYAVGGYNGTFLGTVEAYDPSSNTWATKASMPTARGALGTNLVSGIIYAVGGGDSSTIFGTVEAFTPCSYQVVSTDKASNFGFTAPVLNPGSGGLPNINSASVNQAIPLQVSVTDCKGNPMTNLTLAPPTGSGTVVLSAANSNLCAIDIPDNSISTSAAGNSGWQNLGGGNYQYNWKPLPPKGSCLSFSLNLGDGIQHTAYFQFK